MFRTVACAVALLLFSWAPAQASTIIDFTGGSGGTVSYAGGLNSLIGSNIAIDSVLGINTPANSGTSYAVTSGFLNFQTGNLSTFDGGTGVYNFSGGGTFTITGGVAAAGIAPTVLLSGSFVSAWISPTLGVSFFLGQGSDTKNLNLVSFFGLPTDSLFAFGPASVHLNSNTPSDGSAFSLGAHSTDVSNTVVPEPGSMMLFGSGLVGLSTLVRRRKQAKASNEAAKDL